MDIKKIIRNSCDFQYFLRNTLVLLAVGIFFGEMYFIVDESSQNNMLISSGIFIIFAIYYITRIRLLFKNINGFIVGSTKLIKNDSGSSGRLASFKANAKFNDGTKKALVTKRIFAFSAISFGAPRIKNYDGALVKILYNKSTQDVIVIKKNFKLK